MARLQYLHFGLLVLLLSNYSSTLATETDVKRLIKRMESDVLALKDEVERVYQLRCKAETFDTCARNVYDNCVTSHLDRTCRGGIEFQSPTCGSSSEYGIWYDYINSNVILPTALMNGIDGNPTDPQVIETICFTQALDEYFVRKYEEDREFWSEFGVEPAWMHFGSHTGMYRIFPGRQASDCGFFDPRNRPWYIAASSGPKNIVLVLDVSGSMDSFERLVLMKRAASRVIETLAAGDRVAIVPFSTKPSVIADRDENNNGVFFKATAENKEFLIKEIQNLTAEGATNFLDSFNATFKLVEDSIISESHVPCNSAILFLTDGEMTEPEGATEAEVIQVVNTGIDNLKTRLGHSVTLFTYSVSDSGDVHEFPKTLACSTGDGIWSKIVDEDQIIESLNSYSQLFALGIGVGSNQDFTTWVQPYDFFDMEGVPGVTVAAPVYDRTKSPPLFLGVVGVDFLVAAADKAYGVPQGSLLTLEILEKQAFAKCPRVATTLCEREAFRARGLAGEEAMCTNSCSAADFVNIDEQKCAGISDLPWYLFANSHNLGLKPRERMCCAVIKENEPLDASAATSQNDERGNKAPVGAIASSVAGILVIALGVLVWRYKKRLTLDTSASVAQNGSWTALTALAVLTPQPSAPQKNQDYDC